MSAAVEKVRVYTDHAGEWRWTALAGNGEEVADSGEGYVNREYAAERARELFPAAEIDIEPAE